MRNLYKIIIFFLLSLSLSLSSCLGYLDQVPDEILTEENMFESKDDAIRVLTDAYAYIKSTGDFKETPGLAADHLDYVFLTYGPSIKDRGQYSQSSLIFNFWDDFYKGIRTSMFFLDRIDECKDEKLTELERDLWKGEAYFLQAYYYYLLLMQYGPIPIMDKVYSTEEILQVMGEGIPRQDFNTCVEHIDDLLVKAIEKLDLFYTTSSPERIGRASQASAWFLRSRLWLYAASPLYNGMADVNGKDYSRLMPKDHDGKDLLNATYNKDLWKKSMDITEEAIQVAIQAERGLLTAADGYTASWKAMTHSRGGTPSSENILFQRHVSSWPIIMHVLPISWAGYSGTSPTMEHVQEYFMANGLLPNDDVAYKALNMEDNVTYEVGGNTIKLYKKFMKRDPRFYVNILFPGQYSYAVIGNEIEKYDRKWAANSTPAWSDHVWFRPFYDGPDGFLSKSRASYCTTGFLAIKYLAKTSTKNSTGDYAVNIFRYPELLLNYSEAAFEYYAANGQNPATQTEVFKYWDEIRERVQIPTVRDAYNNAGIPLTTEKLRELVRREREIELSMEGHRYFDNRRWLIAEREGGAKHGFDIYKLEEQGFMNENYVFETRAWHDKMYFMPIPQTETEKNIKLTQNPFW